jgi:hypothetical protein
MKNRHRHDDNHAAIKAHLKEIPALELLDTSQYAEFGCDLLLLFRSVVYFVEIKNEERASGMTPSELRLQAMCERTGCRYVLADTSEDILREIGAI